MRAATVFAISLAVAGASAQSTTACAAQNIVDTCIASIKPRLDACKGNDWECYCTNSRDLATCYNNCPGIDRSGVDNQVTSYCGAYSAAVAASSATAKTPTASGTATSTAAAATATGTGTGTTTAGSTGTQTGFAGSTSTAASAGMVVIPAKSFGALAGLMAVAGAFL
ncbi:hypothetical protein FN846DRAFT_911702 [Sphaerosporella brunnea]|uniref:GPI anchored serine-threonine rich protein n=1 Tax=Sphaerosporella brunnea TaxID=1250544 RepID=A0A5J5EKA3_9PEZI|nr:hypothetical protein FN846DRAFT_911702 [Sphaerosporella brunnea]